MKRLIATTLLTVLLLFSTVLPAVAQDASPRTAQITASYTDKAQYDVYEADATAGAITLTLIAPSKRRVVVVVKTDSSANAVTVATAGTGATINGASTYVLSSQNSAAIFYANGKSGSSGVWRVASSSGSTGSDLFFSSQARGDIIRRNASSWGRYSAKTSGQILVGDGTDVVSVAVSGDATLSSAGAVTIAAAAVTRAKQSAASMRKSLLSDGATVATTSNTDFYIIVPETGTLDGVDFSGIDALAANDTNYVTFSITNLGQAGAGTAVMLAATAANTTQVTGGSALAANTKRSLTLTATGADLVVAAGDRLRIRVAATGTLANTVTGSKFLLRFGGTT